MNVTRNNNRGGARLVLLSAAAAVATALAGCGSMSAKYATDPFALGSGRDPTPRTLLVMARILYGQGRSQHAEYVLNSILNDNPAYTPASIDLADVLMTEGREDEAIAVLQDARELTPNDPVLANNAGMVYLAVEEHEAALASFEAASELNPQEPRYRANTALTLALLGREDEALGLYEAVLPPGEAYWNIAVVFESLDRPDKALEWYRKAHEIDSTLGADAEAARLEAMAKPPGSRTVGWAVAPLE